MYDRFTDEAMNVVQTACGVALSSQHQAVSPGHILMGLVTANSEGATNAFSAAPLLADHVSPVVLTEILAAQDMQLALDIDGQPPLTEAAVQTLERATPLVADMTGHDDVYSGHILCALLENDIDEAGMLLYECGADPMEIRNTMLTQLRTPQWLDIDKAIMPREIDGQHFVVIGPFDSEQSAVKTTKALRQYAGQSES